MLCLQDSKSIIEQTHCQPCNTTLSHADVSKSSSGFSPVYEKCSKYKNIITVFLCAAVSVLICSYVCTGDIQIRIMWQPSYWCDIVIQVLTFAVFFDLHLLELVHIHCREIRRKGGGQEILWRRGLHFWECRRHNLDTAFKP